MLLRKQRYLADRIQQLTSQDVEQRLRAFLLEQYGRQEQIHAEINKKQLAAAIDATPETLSATTSGSQATQMPGLEAGDYLYFCRLLERRLTAPDTRRHRYRYRDRYRSSRRPFSSTFKAFPSRRGTEAT